VPVTILNFSLKYKEGGGGEKNFRGDYFNLTFRSQQEVQQLLDGANGVECSTSMTTGSGRGGSGLLEVDEEEVVEDQQLTIKGTKLTLVCILPYFSIKIHKLRWIASSVLETNRWQRWRKCFDKNCF